MIANQFTRADVAERVCAAVDAGVMWVQLRDHEASEAGFGDAATTLVDRLRGISGEVMISVNSRPQVARDLGVHYHRGKGKPVLLDRGDGIQGYSAHTMAEVKDHAGMDYLFYSPIFPTGSKPGHPGVGVVELAEVTEQAMQLVYALGGIKPQHCAACLGAGAYGVAVISGILQADDIEASVHAYLKAINTEAVT
ncbi:MAG: thiamine phosphate synthase [Bacteroidota bacterium]